MSRAPCLVWLLVGCKPLPPRGPAPAELAAALPRLVLLPDDTATEVCLEASVHAGSAYDPVGAEGTASLVAHALVAAADARRPTGVPPITLHVGKEDVVVALRCPVALADACAATLVDAIGVPSFTIADVDAARAQALQALVAPSAAALADEVVDDWVFEAHPYGHPVLGRTGALPVIDALALRRFYAAHYVRRSTILGVGGGPVALGESLAVRAAVLGATMTPDLPLLHAVPPPGRALLVVDAGAGEAVELRLGRAVDPGEDTAPLILGAELLARATGLDVALVGLDPTPGTHRRRPFLRVRLPPVTSAEAPAALRAAVALLDVAVHAPPPLRAIEEARAAITDRLAATAADPCARLASAVDAVATDRLDAIDHLGEALAAVAPEQVALALTEHLDPATLRLVAVGPDGAALTRALATDPVPSAPPTGADVPLVLTITVTRPADGIFR